jgi:hypothetical protein
MPATNKPPAMNDPPAGNAATFPRRDAAGRVRSLAELAVASGLGTLVGLAAPALIEGLLVLLGLSSFGSASGWLAAILPSLLFFDDLRAWRGYGVRFLVAPVGLALALVVGLLAAGVARGLPAMVSGSIGALVAALVYAPVWFLGIHWLTPADRTPEDEP